MRGEKYKKKFNTFLWRWIILQDSVISTITLVINCLANKQKIQTLQTNVVNNKVLQNMN